MPQIKGKFRDQIEWSAAELRTWAVKGCQGERLTAAAVSRHGTGAARHCGHGGGTHNGIVRGQRDHRRARGGEGLGLDRSVQVSRGLWRREEFAGAIRSEGWWESVTVTWSPAATPPRRSPLLQRALATAVDAITPTLVDLMAAGAWRLIARRPGTRAIPPAARRELRPPAAALPPGGRHA